MTILCATGKLHMILLTKTDCAFIQICNANLMLYQLSVVMPQIGRPIYKPLFEVVVAFTKILRVMLGTHGRATLWSLMYQAEIQAKLILPTPSENLCYRQTPAILKRMSIIGKNIHNEKCHQKLYIPNKQTYLFILTVICIRYVFWVISMINLNK